MTNDLELLREIFKDTRQYVSIGVVQQLAPGLAGNVLRVRVNLIPENREIIAEMTWSDVMTITFPEVNDLVLVAFADGHEDQAFVIKLLTTKEEPIPTFALSGHSVFYSRAGKKAYLGSDTKVGIGRPAFEPTEPLVLGNVLSTALQALLNIFIQANPLVDTPLGPGYLDPGVTTQINNWISQYLTTASTNVLSQIAFTERGQ